MKANKGLKNLTVDSAGKFLGVGCFRFVAAAICPSLRPSAVVLPYSSPFAVLFVSLAV
ncbi:MAG: hypothetical protein JO025_18380 [Verrucomicrobia bacterium]|nr:hypothetical protein [Verrucomicrobiota bacterium]